MVLADDTGRRRETSPRLTGAGLLPAAAASPECPLFGHRSRSGPPADLLDVLPGPEQADRRQRHRRGRRQGNRRRETDRLELAPRQGQCRRGYGQAQPEPPQPGRARLQSVRSLRPHALPLPCPLNGRGCSCCHKATASHMHTQPPTRKKMPTDRRRTAGRHGEPARPGTPWGSAGPTSPPSAPRAATVCFAPGAPLCKTGLPHHGDTVQPRHIQ